VTTRGGWVSIRGVRVDGLVAAFKSRVELRTRAAFDGRVSDRFRRPVGVGQGDALNRSGIATVICVALTGDMKCATAPGNALLPSSPTGLPKASVANVSQLVTLDKIELTERAGKLSRSKLDLMFSGIDAVPGSSTAARQLRRRDRHRGRGLPR
jgi:mRNA interferase MazF